MSSAWSKLTELPRQHGVRAAWGTFPEELLLLTANCASALPCEAGHACQRKIIEHGAGDLVGICAQDPAHCDPRPVTKVERAVYRLNHWRLFDRIAGQLNNKGDAKRIGEGPEFWSLSGIPTVGDHALPVFFVFAATAAEIDQALGRLMMSPRECYLLILSDSRCQKPTHQETALACRSLIIALDDLLCIGPDGNLTAVAGGRATVAAWKDHVAPAPSVIGGDSKFPTPPGTEWTDITITFLSRDTFLIKCAGQAARSWDRILIPEMFLANTAHKKPSFKWHLLLTFAVRGPFLSNPELERFLASHDGRDKLKKQMSDLRAVLRRFFGLEGDPLPYDRKNKLYKPALAIRLDTNARAELWGDE